MVMAKESRIGAYFVGFLVGVVATILFFYFGGWDWLAGRGDKVERRLRKGVDEAGEVLKDKGKHIEKKADEWIDSTFEK